jgi:hypothetical protein
VGAAWHLFEGPDSSLKHSLTNNLHLAAAAAAAAA